MKIIRKNKGKQLFVWFVLAPTIIFFISFFYLPILSALTLSFTNADTYLSKPNIQFVQFSNYLKVLKDPLTWVVLKNTFYFSIIVVIFGTAVSFTIALMLNSIQKLRSFYRTIYFIPAITSLVATSLIWKALYQPRFGLLNQILELLSLSPLKWLNDPKIAMLCIVFLSIWKSAGFNAVIFLAGLSGIPKEYLEASSLDGANSLRRFWHITLPLLKPTFTFVLITTMIDSLQVFVQPYVMTNPRGGPMDSTRTFVMLIYEKAFHNFQGGYTAALSILLLILILCISYFQLKVMKTDWEY